VLPEVVEWEENSIYAKSVSYMSVIPVTVEAIKEVDLKYEMEVKQLKEEIKQLKRLLEQQVGNVQFQNHQSKSTQSPSSPAKRIRPGNEIGTAVEPATLPVRLEQNIPNPFTQSTIIPYYVPNEQADASLRLYDMGGKEVARYPLAAGQGQVTIDGAELEARSYCYKLYLNGRPTATRKMLRLER